MNQYQVSLCYTDRYESNNSGELGGQSLDEAEFRSPMDLTSRTPTHIRFAASGINQLVKYPVVARSNREPESQSSQMIAIRNMEQQLSLIRSEILEIRRISQDGKILNRRSRDGADSRMDSSGPIAQEESPRTAPIDLSSQQIVEASSNINSVDTRDAPSTAMMDRRVRYPSIAVLCRPAQKLQRRRAY